MITKYTTGQAVLVPAVIRSAEEINGQIKYHVDAELWDGIPEDQIVIDDKVTAKAAYDRAMRDAARNMAPF